MPINCDFCGQKISAYVKKEIISEFTKKNSLKGKKARFTHFDGTPFTKDEISAEMRKVSLSKKSVT
jgi:hypothetical protein